MKRRRPVSVVALVFFSVQFFARNIFVSAFSTKPRNNNHPHDKQQLRAKIAPHGESLSPTAACTYLVLGGTGQIGSEVAHHILIRQPQSTVLLVGRSELKGQQVVRELQSKHPQANIQFQKVTNVWDASEHNRLQQLLQTNHVDCMIHTAGPYANRTPIPLQLARNSPSCRAYVDVADPLPYLEQALLLSNTTDSTNTTALVAAGAFPGMSNVLGVEAVAHLDPKQTVESLRFQYFTAGLGGSGPVNLFITNVGFGDPMTQYDGGALRFFMQLSGVLLGKVDFFLPTVPLHLREANELVRQRVGTKQVFSWPFPEAATVPTILKELDTTESPYKAFRWRKIDSSAAMGTAPDVWNTMLGVLVRLIPRSWWRNERFSQFLADFSQPLVGATDAWLKWKDPFANGETHAMRIDAKLDDQSGVSIIQAHDSFRQCVAQSCAEFAMDCLEYPNPGTVSLPEQRYSDPVARQRIIEKLTSTPGTFCFTGPVSLQNVDGPSRLQEALEDAQQQEKLKMAN